MLCQERGEHIAVHLPTEEWQCVTSEPFSLTLSSQKNVNLSALSFRTSKCDFSLETEQLLLVSSLVRLEVVWLSSHGQSAVG